MLDITPLTLLCLTGTVGYISAATLTNAEGTGPPNLLRPSPGLDSLSGTNVTSTEQALDRWAVLPGVSLSVEHPGAIVTPQAAPKIQTVFVAIGCMA